MRKSEELKAPHYASAAATRDYITARDIIPNIYFIYMPSPIIKVEVLYTSPHDTFTTTVTVEVK